MLFTVVLCWFFFLPSKMLVVPSTLFYRTSFVCWVFLNVVFFVSIWLLCFFFFSLQLILFDVPKFSSLASEMLLLFFPSTKQLYLKPTQHLRPEYKNLHSANSHTQTIFFLHCKRYFWRISIIFCLNHFLRKNDMDSKTFSKFSMYRRRK